MNKLAPILYLLIGCLCFGGCSDNKDEDEGLNRHGLNPTPVSIDYYPQGRGYEWTYDLEEINGSDTVNLTTYDKYVYLYGWIDGRFRQPYLDTDGSPGGCGLGGFGGNLIMANFCLPDTSADSVLLDVFEVSGNTLSTYQFTKDEYVIESKNYQSLPCKKTLFIGEIDSTGVTYKYSWFAKDVGMVKTIVSKL